MITTVWKLRPTSIWKISEIENWLSDMAKEGFHLYKMGIQFGKFKRGEAQDLLYRIDIADEKDLTDEDILTFERSGWKHITSFNKFHIYASPNKNNIAPFPINREKQLAVIKQKKINHLLSLSFSLLIIILNIWLQFYAYSSGMPVILPLIEGYSSFHPLFIVPFVLNSYSDVVRFRLMSKYQKQLIDDAAMNDYAEWQLLMPRRIFGLIWYTIIIIGTMLIILLPLLKMESKTLPAEDTQPYIVRLHSIEHPETPKYSKIPSEEYTYESSVFTSGSIFAPKYYEVYESFATYENVHSNTLPSISSNVYELSFSFLVEPLLQEIIKDTSRFDDQTKLQKISHKQFDFLYVLEQDSYVRIYAAKDSIVTYVMHSGNPKTDTLIEQLASKFNE